MGLSKLAIVVPCYNEELVLPETSNRLLSVLRDLIEKGKISSKSFILFVDDGSTDRTWSIIEELVNNNSFFKGIKLSRNVGHQIALIAGMEYVADKCDCVITIDADLQQDESVIEEFVDKYLDGYDIVLGIKKDRGSDKLFKKVTAIGFYKFMKLCGVNIVENHPDYRLLSRKALFSLLEFKESNIFLRGIITLLGYRTAYVYFNVKERFAGEPKYNIGKMLQLAIDGITSFTVVPLRIISFIGIAVFLLSLITSVYVVYLALFTNKTVPGWASTVLPVYFIGGIQLLSLGVIGEYIGKIYIETKRRPRYFIEKCAGDK